MKPLSLLLSLLFLGAAATPSFARNTPQHVWQVVSPDHGQTFTYGSEQRRSWCTRNNHLAVLLDYTNDPYVDRINVRQYDYFTFGFPQIVLGPDKRTFYYHTPDGRSIAVAHKTNGFLGIEETKLLSNAYLTIKKPHGKLTLTLTVWDHPLPNADD